MRFENVTRAIASSQSYQYCLSPFTHKLHGAGEQGAGVAQWGERTIGEQLQPITQVDRCVHPLL